MLCKTKLCLKLLYEIRPWSHFQKAVYQQANNMPVDKDSWLFVYISGKSTFNKGLGKIYDAGHTEKQVFNVQRWFRKINHNCSWKKKIRFHNWVKEICFIQTHSNGIKHVQWWYGKTKEKYRPLVLTSPMAAVCSWCGILEVNFMYKVCIWSCALPEMRTWGNLIPKLAQPRFIGWIRSIDGGDKNTSSEYQLKANPLIPLLEALCLIS